MQWPHRHPSFSQEDLKLQPASLDGALCAFPCVDFAVCPVRNQSWSWESSLRVTEPKVVVRAWFVHTAWTAGAQWEAMMLQIPTYSAHGGHWGF